MTSTQIFITFVIAVNVILGLGIGIFFMVSFFNLCQNAWLLKNALIKK